ncbi:MAG: acyl-CoA dehydrogenase family protein [Alphaproteobacteria bacterium]
MDFSFTEEQTLLRNTVERFVLDNYEFETRRQMTATEEGRNPANWAQLAELGILAAPFSEDHGGLGYGATETMVVMEELGKGLVVDPYFPSIVLGGGLLRHGGGAIADEVIPQVAMGEDILAFAYAEPKGRFNLADLETTAKADGGDYVINGHKAVVIGAPFATKLLVSTRTSGGVRDADGVTVFVVDAKADGVSIRSYPTVDGLRAGEVYFENVKVPANNIVGELDNGLPLIEQVADEAIAALSAEATGAMKVLTDATVEYSKTRVQFGQAIGKFQVLQHRMADMFMAHEQSTSMTYMVTMKLDEDAKTRGMAASAAKVQIGKAGREVGQSAVQIHGGMGMTDELNVGHYFKRLTMIDAQFGNVDYHLKRYATLSKS